MARLSLPVFALIVAGLAAPPAAAQFSTIFRDDVPRPPGDVPSQPPAREEYPPPVFRNDYPPPVFPRQQARPAPPLAAPPIAPRGDDRDGDFQGRDQAARGIQSEPLPPPPGATVAPQDTAVRPTAPGSIIQPEPGAPPPTASQPPTPQQPGDPQPQTAAGLPAQEVVVAPPPHRIPNPTAVFAGLDKITGRIIKFDVAINETVQFGALQVTPRVCYTRPPTEAPRTDAFLAVDEVTLQGEVRRIFTGWMFASSPGLHAVEHPIYDVWLADCKGGKQEVAAAKEEPEPPPPPQPRRSTRQR
jgi:hypothetical protein